MIEVMWQEIMTGWIWAAIPIAAMYCYRVWQRNFQRQYGKFTLYRIVRLRVKNRGDKPYYTRHHHFLDAEEDVYDEAWVINGVQSNYPTQFSALPLTSSGMVDAYMVLPEVLPSADNHPHLRSRKDEFRFSYPEPTTRMAVAGVLVNGLQNESDWWYGTTAQYDSQDLTLVVDFSSVPDASKVVKNVSAHVERTKKGGQREKQPLPLGKFGDDIFSTVYEGADKNDTIKITFEIDIDNLERLRTENIDKVGSP